MKTIIGIIFFGSCCFSFVQPIQAVEGITVSPPSQSIELQASQSSKRFSVTFTNHTSQTVTLELSTQDFGGLDQSGGILILGSQPNKRWDDYRLTPWLSVEDDQLVLSPGQQRDIAITVTNSQSLSPGGHYGALMATIDSRDPNSQVSINQTLTSLFFVNKVDGAQFGIEANQINSDRSWWGQIERAEAIIANTGNTHVVPRGTVRLEDPFNRVIAQGVINQGSQILLPTASADFATNLTQQHLPLWPGTYSLVLSYRYDGVDQLATTTTEVFSFGIVAIMVTAIGGCAATTWLVRKVVLRHE